MGKILQIRVTASTFRPEDVKESWPRLSALAWPHPPRVAGPPMEARGVLELVTTLHDRVRFVLEEGTLRRRVIQGIEGAAELKTNLEAALADWDAESANRMSRDLESALGELERVAPEVPFVVSKPDGKQRSGRLVDKLKHGEQSPRSRAASDRIRRFFKALFARR